MENKDYIKNLLLRFAEIGDSANAFSLYDGKWVTDVTYKVFAGDILRTAGYFRSHGIRGQHIALIAPNSYGWLTVYFAITASGNVPVLLNPALPENILLDQCRMTDVSLVCGQCNPVGDIPTLDFSELRSPASVDMAGIAAPDPEATAMLMFTSGTTGKSKAVEFTHRNMAYSIHHTDGFFLGRDMERTLLVLPMYHIGGLRGALTFLQRGRTVCIGRGIAHMLLDMPKLSPTQVLLVPSMAESLVKLLKRTKSPEEREKYIGKHLHRIVFGGADVKSAVCQHLMDLGFSVESGYAMTETAGVGTWGLWDPEHPNTIGKPFGRMHCRIQDGEILLKGPSIMKGYYKDPDATARILRDGWIHTGDLGYCDSAGYYYITGRKKNVIILSNGENVSPEDIEDALNRCEAIRECLVYGDEKGIRADICADDQQAALSYIRAYNQDMPLYRQVYKVNFSAEPLEKSASGKLKRKEDPHVQ